MWKIILAFAIAQLINVILSTLKNVLTIKGGKWVASISNAIAHGFNTIVIKFIADVDMWVAVLISTICNLIGVYVALWLMQKLRKDQLWKITATVTSENYENLISNLKENEINYIAYETIGEKYRVLDVFSKDKNQSKIVKKLFDLYGAKFTILANSGTL